MYFLDLDNEAEGWGIYASSPPLVETPGLIHIASNLVAIGTCYWLVPEFCCDRRSDLFYIFDWETKTWSNEYIDTVSPEEWPGNSVEVSTEFLHEDLNCIGIKWPKCVQHSLETNFQNANITTGFTFQVESCARLCAMSTNCELWVYSELTCYMYFKYLPLQTSGTETSVKYGRKDCFEKYSQ